jgi:putative hydrolase of HD superfamily
MQGTVEQLMSFVRLLNDYRAIQRRLFVNGEDRRENDVEHSYQLAMLCWYIIETEHLTLDVNRVLKYALLHDLVEVYAGDTPFFSNDMELKGSKQQRERMAHDRLMHEHPEFAPIGEYISEYEQRESPESKFVYAADKLQPILNIYADNGRTWKDENVTYGMEVEMKRDKVAIDPTIHAIYDEFMKLVTEHKEELFHQE